MRNARREIYGELFEKKVPDVADAAALADAKKSLERMLRDYMEASPHKYSPEEIARRSAELDMGVVSRECVAAARAAAGGLRVCDACSRHAWRGGLPCRSYEREIQSPIVGTVKGDLVQLMLVQIQFIKKELMVAMGALDQLLRENHFNLQLLATIPGLIVIAGAGAFVRF